MIIRYLDSALKDLPKKPKKDFMAHIHNLNSPK